MYKCIKKRQNEFEKLKLFQSGEPKQWSKVFEIWKGSKCFIFFPGDLVIPKGDREIRSSCRRLPDNQEELA